MVRPILEASGLTVGVDFFLAYCPKRADPGDKRYTTRDTHKGAAKGMQSILVGTHPSGNRSKAWGALLQLRRTVAALQQYVGGKVS